VEDVLERRAVDRRLTITAGAGNPTGMTVNFTILTEAMTVPVAVVNLMNYKGWECGKTAATGATVMLPARFFSRHPASGLSVTEESLWWRD
jgi:hypothetical protein